MAVVQANGIELNYDEFGNTGDPAVVLIMGFSAQSTAWPVSFCERIAARGYRVIRFDNRDIGLSTKFSGTRADGNKYLRLARFQAGLASPAPYTLVDMAADTVGLLDALDLDDAHLVGASMGGMISQIVTATTPERVRTLNILFSSTLQPLLPVPRPDVIAMILGGPGAGASEQQRIAFSAKLWRKLNGRVYGLTPEEAMSQAKSDYARDYTPSGVIRQFYAATGTGSLLPYSTTIDRPTLVVHGTDDPLLPLGHGKAVAKAIPQSRLHVIKGYGHNIPESISHELADTFTVNLSRG